MIIRLRSRYCPDPSSPVKLQNNCSAWLSSALYGRDGLERIQVHDDATVAHLKQQINATLDIPVEAMTLSRNKDLV